MAVVKSGPTTSSSPWEGFGSLFGPIPGWESSKEKICEMRESFVFLSVS